MIYVTGDTHGLIDIGKLIEFASTNNITTNDFVIVAGDFGAIWDVNSVGQYVDIYNNFPFTTLFVDGNHENFDFLYAFPIEEWNGGKIHRISKKIIHLMRGEVFFIDGIKILAIGGAESDDKELRIKHLSWWPQETITKADINRALESASKYKQIDYIVTHTCPQKYMTKELLTTRKNKTNNESEENLDIIAEKVSYFCWYFGHWHKDQFVAPNVRAVYNDIIKLNLLEEAPNKTCK